MLRWLSAALLGFAFVSAGAQVRVDKVDPPNWWASMPKPMLLLHGEGLAQAKFALSDKAVRIERVVPSENGHWAQLWLSASPAKAETVKITVSEKANAAHKVEVAYRFEQKKPASAGFQGFHSDDVMYLIMTDRFADGDTSNDGEHANASASSAEAKEQRAMPRGWHGGDLRGVMQHVEYLQQLGVSTVWTTPVYENHEADSYHGYGATDMYRVDEHYGSLADLQALVAALHEHHMKYVLDTVPNHVGPGHPWVKDPPAPDWFHGSAAKHEKAESDFRALINPHASEREKRGTLTGWFANALPDMNSESPAVAQYLRQNAIWWVEETGADGLRIDTYPYVSRPFWHQFHAMLREVFPHLTSVGETFSPNPVLTSSYAGGVTRNGADTGLDTPFDFPTYFALRNVFLKGESMQKMVDVLADDSLYPHPERLPMFVGNHDTTRFREEAKSEAAMQMALAYLFTTRGMPQLYSGDEIAMRGKDDPDNRHDFPGGFPDSTKSAFTEQGRTAEQQRMFGFVSELAKLHAGQAALACGGEQLLYSDDNTLVYLRDASHAAEPAACAARQGAKRVIVAVHRGAAVTRAVPTDATWFAGHSLREPLMGGEASHATASHDKPEVLELSLGKDSVLVLAVD